MGSSAPSGTTSTVNQSNLPEYARPYFERLMKRGEEESNQGYTPYTGDRVAAFNGDQQWGQQGVRDIFANGSPMMDDARGRTEFAGNRAMDTSNFASNNISTGNFDSAAAQQYMSPYQQNVVDAQKQGAVRDFREGQAARNDPAIRSGAFGGMREGVQRGVEERGLSNRLSDIQAAGSQAAYTNAQGQFERDRSQGFTTAATNESNRRAAAETAQKGAAIGLGAGAQLGNLATSDQTLSLQRAGALREVGDQESAKTQQGLDLAYSDFVNQRDYDRQQLNFYSGIMRGVPVTANSEVSNYQSTNPMSQALGLGVAGLAAYRAK